MLKHAKIEHMNNEISSGNVTSNPLRVWRTIAGAARAVVSAMFERPGSPVQYNGAETVQDILCGTATFPDTVAVSQEV